MISLIISLISISINGLILISSLTDLTADMTVVWSRSKICAIEVRESEVILRMI